MTISEAGDKGRTSVSGQSSQWQQGEGAALGDKESLEILRGLNSSAAKSSHQSLDTFPPPDHVLGAWGEFKGQRLLAALERPEATKSSEGSKIDAISSRLLKHLNGEDKGEVGKALESFKRERLDKLGVEESAKLLLQIERILSPESVLGFRPRTSLADRVLLAKQFLSLATSPKMVNQAWFNDCELATIEKVLWEREPAAVASLVVQAALRGSVKNYDGKDLPLSAEPFRKDLKPPPGRKEPNDRLLSSQIFQTALIEREWAGRDIGFGKGALKYKMGTPKSENDSGQRLVDKDGKALFDVKDKGSEVFVNDPGIDFSRMAKIYDSLASKPLKGRPLVLASTEAKGFLPKDELSSMVFVDPRRGPDGLNTALKDMKDNKQFPIIVVIALVTKNDKGEEEKDLHVVTISDYDPKTKIAVLHDQFGPDSKDEKVSLRALNKRMIIDDLQPWQLPKPKVELRKEK